MIDAVTNKVTIGQWGTINTLRLADDEAPDTNREAACTVLCCGRK